MAWQDHRREGPGRLGPSVLARDLAAADAYDLVLRVRGHLWWFVDGYAYEIANTNLIRDRTSLCRS